MTGKPSDFTEEKYISTPEEISYITQNDAAM